jgi:hypothetical protein
MARNPQHGPEANARDVQALTRVLNRVQQDTTRPAPDRDALIENLGKCISLLVLGRPARKAVRKAG